MGKDENKNINAESHLINGILGMIPGALVGGPLGAIGSLLLGGIFARGAIRSAERKKQEGAIYLLQRESQFKKEHPYYDLGSFECECLIYERLYPLYKDVECTECCYISDNYYSVITKDCVSLKGKRPEHPWEMLEEVDDILNNGYESITVYRHNYKKAVCIKKKNGENIFWHTLQFKRSRQQ